MYKRLNILKYSFAAILLSIPLFPKFPLIKMPQTQVSIRLEDFLILATSMILLPMVLRKRKAYLDNRITRIITIFLLVGLVSTLSGILLTRTVILHIGVLHWLRRVEYLVVFFIAYEALKSKKDLGFYIKILLITVLYAFLFGVGQKYFNLPVITTQNPEYAKGIALFFLPGSHLVSTFAGHYDLASYIVLTIPIFLGFVVAEGRTLKELRITSDHLYTRILFLGVVFFAYWLLINAASRISIVGYLAAVVLVLLFLKKYALVPVVVALSIGLTLFSSNLMDRYMRIINVGLERVALVGSVYAQDPKTARPMVFEDRSTSIRLNVEWPRAVRAFNKNPLLGTGYSSITLATDNGFLRLLGELGALGVWAFSLLMAAIYMKLFTFWRRAKKRDIYYYYTAGVLAAIPGVMINMVFIDVLEASKFAVMFWALTGLAVKSTELAKK